MKFIKLFVIALAFTGVAAYGDDQMHVPYMKVRTYTAQMTDWHIDSKLPYAYRVNSASVFVEFGTNEISLQMYITPDCPPNAMCSLGFKEVRLPLIAKNIDRCGSRVYSAVRNETPVDGAIERIIVRDNTKNHCPSVIALPPTEVEYTTEVYNRFEGLKIVTQSQFSGEKLERASVVRPFEN